MRPIIIETFIYKYQDGKYIDNVCKVEFYIWCDDETECDMGEIFKQEMDLNLITQFNSKKLW